MIFLKHIETYVNYVSMCLKNKCFNNGHEKWFCSRSFFIRKPFKNQ